MNYLNKISIFSMLLLAACFPKDEAVKPKPRVNNSVTLDAGVYKNTVTFYSMDEAMVVAEASPMEWDFYIDENVVRLNYFRSMRVAKFNKSWDNLEDTVGLDFKYLTYDNEAGSSQWELKEGQIYVVDYGQDNSYNQLGLTSVRFERIAGGMKIWHNALGSDYEVYEEVMEPSFYYNLREKKALDMPTEKEYDLAFGKYTDLVTNDNITQDYLIYGCLQGRALAYSVNEAFDSVKTEMFDMIRLMDRKNVIGWDWKNFNLPKNAYEIISNQTYLILSNAGFKYKLRFVNFYNTSGQSGHPTFEWELL